MSAGDLIAYRSTDPDVLAAVDAAYEAITAYVKQEQAVLDGAGLGHYKVWATSNGWTPRRFLGLDIPEGESPPPGWRMNREYAVPDKRTAAGKHISAAIAAVRHPGDPRHALIGMPPDVLTPGGFQSCGMRRIGDALYVTWRNCDPAGAVRSFTAGAFEIDAAKWERVPLSAYYAAVEAEESDAA
jgi:hypothetical protein